MGELLEVVEASEVQEDWRYVELIRESKIHCRDYLQMGRVLAPYTE